MKEKKSLLFILLLVVSLPIWSNDFSVLTRFQVDSSGKYAESRVRVDMSHSFDPSYNAVYDIRGFGLFHPVEYIGIGAGNSFFKKYAVKGAWLSASDDYLKTGKLLKSGAGLLGKIPVSENILLSLSFSGSPEIWNESDEIESEASIDNSLINLNAGGELSLFDSFSLGTVFYKMNSSSMQFGIYAGIKPDEGLLNGFLFNAGYIYNFRDSYMAKSRNALMCSLGYEKKDSGIGMYCDFISGLDNQYLKKSGNIKKYDDGRIPFYTAVRLSYEPVKNLILNLSGNYSSFFDDKNGGFGFKTDFEYKISKQLGIIDCGFECNREEAKLNLSWKMKIAENK